VQIRVFCRVRPHPQSVVRLGSGGTSLSLALDSKEHPFTFDKVFGPGIGQQQVRVYLVCALAPLLPDT
jgi:kinesin family protein C1/nucleolar protein 58